MEIFNTTQSLEKRLEYQFPKSIHGLIKDISLKHNQELKEQELLSQHQETLKKATRRKKRLLPAWLYINKDIKVLQAFRHSPPIFILEACFLESINLRFPNGRGLLYKCRVPLWHVGAVYIFNNFFYLLLITYP